MVQLNINDLPVKGAITEDKLIDSAIALLQLLGSLTE
jgi:hypothetical protein